MNIVGIRVGDRRRALRLKQDELCGCLARITYGKWAPSRLDIYRIERGGRLVSDLEIIALAAALECRSAWLLLGEQEGTASAELAEQTFRTAATED